MSDIALKGTRLPAGSRAPKTMDKQRTCARKRCETRLSQYNRKEYCHVHAPTRFPRLRGKILDQS